jgi:leader peptidase (prepilin peptidase)/N-methyltransferase
MGAGSAVGCASLVLLWFAALSAYDIREQRLPNALTLPGGVVVLVAAAAVGRGPAALGGAVGLTGCYLAVHLISPAGLGAGDVKLAIGVGALAGAFGPDVWLLAALAAPLLTAAWVIGSALRRGSGLRRGAGVPHGPSMCVATAAAVALALAQPYG